MPASQFPFFKAYDIRGKVPLEINPELARHVGLAFAAQYNPGTVCIGRDARLSSAELSRFLANGLRDGGADVVDIGLCGTEEVYFATFSQGFGGGVMITASHNPADWNGLKIVREKAIPLSGDSGLFTLRDRIAARDLPHADKRGKYYEKSFRSQYVDMLLGLAGLKGGTTAWPPLTVVADAGNGCAFLVMDEILKHSPDRVIRLNARPDGAFPNGVPNPLLPERRANTIKALKEHKADLGLAWDGDFDRCFFYDEEGVFIEGYYMVGLLAKELLSANPPGRKILHDTRLIWNTREIVLAGGGTPVETKTGHAFMKARMREENALYGGEMSAHHYFRDFGFCDSGMLAWIVLRGLMARTGQSLGQLTRAMREKYPVSGEINREITDPAKAMARIEKFYEKKALDVHFIDGLSMDMGEWRLNVRMSNTEPVLRLNVEARGDEGLMREKTREVLGMMV